MATLGSMTERNLKVLAIVLSIISALILMATFACGCFIIKRKKHNSRNKNSTKASAKSLRHRPSPLTLEEIRYQSVPSQFTPHPLLITPTTPSQFTVPARAYSEGGYKPSLVNLTPSLDGKSSLLSPGNNAPRIVRTMSEGFDKSVKKFRTTPHGKIECFLKYDEENNCLLVQILGKKGHSLSWLTGISNPYIRVTLFSSKDSEASPSSTSQILNLPTNPGCKLDCFPNARLKDCLLKFVILDFDRFSRSEFVAEVLVSLGDVGDLCEGVTICEELMLQQKVMHALKGSLLISLCNQSVAQQLQVIIIKADGISSRSPVLGGSDVIVKTTLETAEACFQRKTKGLRKNSSYIFNEKLVFEVSSEKLTGANLKLEVLRGDKLRHETKIGGVKLGLDSIQALEMRHWSEMLASPQKQIAEWHQLRRF